ncbi:MAG TPA: BatA domain-containing protein [Phycisphaerae bacterium]|nr:BatA domain-containing protein [Phycisphaerae bacterium]
MSPALFGAGAAAVSIPIIIHLLNKRRFRTVIWAAMDFLLAAQRRNARRLLLQRWLLLAVRCLALLILAAGMARLVVDSSALGGALSGQRAVVVVWDDSYSMGYATPGADGSGATAFDRSKRLIGEWLRGIKPSDEVMIVRGSRGGVKSGNKMTLDHAGLAAQVRDAQISDAGTDLAAAFDQAADALKEAESSTRARQVIVLTDFSRSSLEPSGGGEERLKAAAAGMMAHATGVRVIDVGDASQENMAVTGLESQRPLAVAGSSSDFRVTVVNATNGPKTDVPLTVSVDGVTAHTEKLGKIEAGASRTVLVELTIPTAGRHAVEARLPADQLPLDDVRRLMLNVRREIPVLLVDGSPGDGKLTQGSTTYLWAAYGLTVDGKVGSVFEPQRITELELPTTALNQYSEVVLSDTAVPSAGVLENLKKFVESGKLLMIFPGNRTNAALMNEAFGKAGLMPATLGQPVRFENTAEMAKGVAFAPEGFTHPVLAPFGEAYKSGADVGFLTVQTNEYFKLGVPTDGSAETVLRYANGNNGGRGDAAVVEKQLGKGRVVLFASSADTSWNTFGAKPSFVPFIHELTYYSLPRESENLTLRLGDRMNLSVETASAGAWRSPHGGTVSVTPELDQSGQMRLTSTPLTAAGIYTPGDGDQRPVVVVNPDAEEADIRHIGIAQMAGVLGMDVKNLTDRAAELEPQGEEKVVESGASLIGPSLIAAALGLFLVEAFLAMYFSSYGR